MFVKGAPTRLPVSSYCTPPTHHMLHKSHSPGPIGEGLAVKKKRPVPPPLPILPKDTASYIRGAGGHKKGTCQGVCCKQRPPAPNTLVTYSGLPLNHLLQRRKSHRPAPPLP